MNSSSAKNIALYIFLILGVVANAQRPVQRNASDCTGAILICGNTEIGITPTGVGNNEFSQPGNPEPACLRFGQFDQAWFKVDIETDGTFNFVLEPDDGVADYDFAVFGPTTDCSNLGPAIRCSSTNPQNAGVPAATGLNSTSTDLTEGPGNLGDGFLRQLDVKAGESYYIIVALAVGSGGFSINVDGSTTFPEAAVANDVPDIQECDDNDGSRDGFKEFDFSSLDASIIQGQPNALVSYYTTLNDANLGINVITFPFRNSSSPQEIFYRVERTDSQCTDFNSFQIQVDGENINAAQIFICSPNASETFDVATIIDGLIPNNTRLSIEYYNSQNDAETGTNQVSSLYTITTVVQRAYIRINDPFSGACEQIINVPIVIENPPTIATPSDLNVCDDDFDGLITTDLRAQNTSILNGLDPNTHRVQYFVSVADRMNSLNAITTLSNTVNPQPVYVLVTNTPTGCTSNTDFQLVVNPKPVLAQQEDKIYCLNAIDPLELAVEPGFDFYEWSTGESGAALNSINVTAPGDYQVTVTNNFGCTTALTITVNPSDLPIVGSIDVTDFQRGNNSVTINVAGPGNYEFAVDEGQFQDSPSFTGLESGFHIYRVRDKNGCGTVTDQFAVLDYQPFFTPNADGFNDIWTLDALSDFPDARLFIFDRYGKLLRQILPDSAGWDGTSRGEPMPSSSYWFTLEIPERPVVRGFFALKR